ncbi:MAG: NAD(P)/FAD-dependent oxidoreductase [bacterium]|nr:FAD-dependent monooxygenase [Gammaproteobacteria bacterium]
MMTHDLIVIGGGLAGAAVAKVMAGQGSHVLLLERETKFKDRVRGEILMPWGVAEARSIGLYEILTNKCANTIEGWSKYAEAGEFIDRRDLASSNPHKTCALGFSHPEMQSVMIQSAREAGADVVQGANVTGLIPGEFPSVTYKQQGNELTASARLLIGADGRQSLTSKLGGFIRHKGNDRMLFAGLLLQGIDVDEKSSHFIVNAQLGQMISIFPIGQNRFRTYVATNKHKTPKTLSGSKAIPDFINACYASGVPRQWFTKIKAIGPLASFDATPNWVASAYKSNMVLVGDAAGVSDPTWGCGMSLALRDARILSDQLTNTNDWDEGAQSYADQRAEYFESIQRIESWMTDMFLALDDGTNDRRTRALPKIAADATRMPDIVGLGPESPSDEIARQRFYGEC